MKQNILYVSPTMSTSTLSMKDDLFIRLISPASLQAKLIADKIEMMNKENVLILIDRNNEEYTGDVYNSYLSYTKKLNSKQKINSAYLDLTRPKRPSELTHLVDSINPDAIFIISNAIDFGITSQHLHKSKVPFTLYSARWATTGDVIVHGGKSVDGAIMVGTLPNHSYSEKETLFRETFSQLSSIEPTFIPIFTHDAATTLFTALESAETDSPHEIRDIIINIGKYTTLQGNVQIDSLGDAYRDITENLLIIEDGEFKICP